MAEVNLIGSKTSSYVSASTKTSYATMVEPIAVTDSRFSYGKLRVSVDTVTTNAGDSVDSTYHLARIPSSSAGSASVISDHTNGILPAWDHMASVTADPGGMLDVKVSAYEHALPVAGQITLCLHYVVE
jgi:hypothetical protein